MGASGTELFITRENIKRFKEQLASCLDPAKRSTLERLLVAEEARLKELELGSTGQRHKGPKTP